MAAASRATLLAYPGPTRLAFHDYAGRELVPDGFELRLPLLGPPGRTVVVEVERWATADPETDPYLWDLLERLEEGEDWDEDGERLGAADLLPVETRVELFTPTESELRYRREDAALRREALPLHPLVTHVTRRVLTALKEASPDDGTPPTGFRPLPPFPRAILKASRAPPWVTEDLPWPENPSYTPGDAGMNAVLDDDEPSGHPTIWTVCENCGHESLHIAWCGILLCFECWHSQGQREFIEVARTLSTAAKENIASGRRPGIRFVTLTGPSVPVGALREGVEWLLDSYARLARTPFWREHVEGDLLKVEVTWNPDEGWHPHLHLAVVGRFIPSAPQLANPDEGDLRTEWSRALVRSAESGSRPRRGCLVEPHPEWMQALVRSKQRWARARLDDWTAIVDVREAHARADDLEFAKELSKYVSKPTAEATNGDGLPMGDWPADIREELARWVRGGERVRWYCGEHRFANRRSCPSGCSFGRYRIEAVGARRLRWHGRLRTLRQELRAEREAQELSERRCTSCGKGKVLSHYEALRRAAVGWTPPAGVVIPPAPRRLLHSIRTHKSEVGGPCGRSSRSSGAPGRFEWGAEGPPITSPESGELAEEDLFAGRETRADLARRRWGDGV